MLNKATRFAKLVTKHRQALLRYGLRRLPDNSLVDDLVAETFIVAWRKLDQIPSSDEELFWLYGIAGRIVSNIRRSEFRQLRLQGRLSLERDPVCDTSTLSPVDLEGLIHALGELSSSEREILQLTYWEKLSYREISLTLGCSENAVGVRLTRARQSLRELLTSSIATVTQLDEFRKQSGS